MLLSSINTQAATFIVINTNDAGPGSLRDAITFANAAPGADTIIFNIPGAGVQTIAVLSQLPILSDATGGTLIDGLSQTGASAGANPPSTAVLTVELNGFAAGPSHGIWIMSPNNTIRGLIINLFEQDGIRIEGTPAPGTFNNYIYANFLGVDPLGILDLGNGSNQSSPWAGVNINVGPCGIPHLAHDNIVEGNLSSGNYAEGVSISNCPVGDVYNNQVIHNYLGTDITGMIDLGNDHDGVYIGEGAHDNLVDSNVISGNDYEGVCIIGYIDPPSLQILTYNNIVSNNLIGVASDGVSPLGNTRDGVSCGIYGPAWQLGHATDNTIIQNTIANNGRNGVMIYEHGFDAVNGDGNRISQNSIYNNTLLGIDLGDNALTLNDPADLDNGANQELNFPVISNFQYCAGVGALFGNVTIDSDPSMATVEFFIVASDASGHGEGMTYLGATTPDASGNWSVSLGGITISDSITATITDSSSNTSEFSSNIGVSPPMVLSESHNNVDCYGNLTGSIDLTITSGMPGYTHLWSNGATTEDVTGIGASTYKVVVSDLAGCQDSLTVTITEPAAITLSTSVTHASCFGCTDGSIDLTVNGGVSPYAYAWSNTATTEDITGLAAGSYCVTVTDNSGCTDNICDSVNQPVSVAEYSFTDNFVIYPDPLSSALIVHLRMKEAMFIDARIYNMLGRLHFSKPARVYDAGSHLLNLQIQDLPSGVYFLKMEVDGKQITRKFIWL